MPEHGKDPDAALKGSGDELEERIGALEEDIGEAKELASERAADAEAPGEDVAGDWEDESVDAPTGDDPLGFDDPEADEEDDDF